MDDDEDEIVDVNVQIFHNTIRDHIISLLMLAFLYFGSYVLISRFRRRDKEDLFSTDDDEILVYRISLWLCTFSLAIALGAALLLPISIASNEVILLYPNCYYVKWLNSSLIQRLWNQIFLCSNLSIFVFLPFAYLFTESTGFYGHRKGIIARVYETFTVFSLLACVVLGLTYVLSALIDPDKISLLSFLNLGSVHLPFLYSCVSFLGVLLLLVCTPLGFVRLFGVVGQVLLKPYLRNDIKEEFDAFNIEEASLKRKLISKAKINLRCIDLSLSSVHSDQEIYQRKISSNNDNLNKRLNELEIERKELIKLRNSSALSRNIIYTMAMIQLLFLTVFTILLVAQNIMGLSIGLKTLPLSTRQLTLGITSLSALGLIGAILEICIIFYLGAASSVGLYTMPFMNNVKPRRHNTSLSQLIVNCALILMLSSALPLLSRILGITNFDLLGDYGAIEWLGNFQIVLLYNIIFIIATALCLGNKVTKTIIRELYIRLTENYTLFTNFVLSNF